jgi:hypothetical protein
MTDKDRIDPLLDRAISELQKLPAVDRASIARVTAAAAEARLKPAEDDEIPLYAPPRRGLRIWTTIGLVAAAGVIGFIARGASTSQTTEPNRVAATQLRETIQPVAASNLDAAPIPTPFVFESKTAKRVYLVGDFNRWNATAAPMVREPGSGLWSVMLLVAPGRHMYAFMVDDSVFTLDPRAPRAKDPDLGAEGSIVIVGRP